MNCPKCNSELYLDHQDKTSGKYFYTCLNKHCELYKKAFNPTTDDVKKAEIKEQQ